VAVWRSGRHTPSKGITELDRMGSVLTQSNTENMLRFATEARPS
jgi:hypothetical protein